MPNRTAPIPQRHANRRLARLLRALLLGSVLVPGVALATLDLNKSFQPINVAPGGSAKVKIDLFNDELAALSSTQLSDNLPSGLTIAASPAPTNSCGGTLVATPGDTVVTLSGGTVPGRAFNGASGTCSVQFWVNAAIPGTRINTIPAGGASGDSGPNGGLGLQPNPQPASATLTVSPYAPLTGNKSFGSNVVKGNGTVSLTVTINNPNAVALTGLAYADAFPAQLKIASATPSANSCGGSIGANGGGALADGAGGFALAGGALAANGSCAVTVLVRAADPNTAFDATQTNTIPAGAVTTNEAATNSVDIAASLVVQSGGRIGKSFDFAVFNDGTQPATLTLRLGNRNLTPISGASLTDNLPPGVTVAAAPNITTNNCGAVSVNAAAGASQIVVSNAAIPAAANALDAVGECLVNVDVVTTVAGPSVNTIANGSYGAGLPNYSGANATLLGNNFAINVDKAFNPGTLLAGNTTTLTLTLSNASAAPAQISSLTDDLTSADPDGGIVVAASPAASTTCGGTVDAVPGTTTIHKHDGTIPAGGSCTVTVPILVSSTVAPGTYTNVLDNNQLQTNRGSNNGAAFGQLVVPTDLSAFKLFAPDTVPVGSQTTLTITLNNGGPTPATISRVFDSLRTLDTGDHFVVAASPAPTTTCGGTVVAPAGGIAITKTDGAIPANGSCTITVPVLVLPGAPLGTFTNTILPNDIQTSIGANSNPISTPLNAGSAITATKDFNPLTIVRGQNTTLTIRLNNASQSAATSVSLTDALTTLDANGSFTIAPTPALTSTCGGTVAAAPGATALTLNGGTIASAGNCQISVAIVPSGSAPIGTLTNTIPAGNIQSTLGPNTADVTAPLTVNPSVSISKRFVPATVGAGLGTQLEIKIDHAAGAPAFTGMNLSDDLTTLGAGHIVATSPNITNDCGGTITANPGDTAISLVGGRLALGATSCTITVRIQTPATIGSGTNTIPVGALTTNEGQKNDTAASATLTRIAIPNALTLNKSFAPSSINGGRPSVLAILLNNSQSGAIDLDGVALTDTLPAGMVIFDTPDASFSGAGCGGGTISANPLDTSVQLSGATIAAGALCTLQVTVTGLIEGNLTNRIDVGALSSNQGATNGNAPAATLTVLRNINITKSFTPSTVVAGGTSTLTLRFVNAQSVTRTNGALIDNFPPGLFTAGAATQNTCSGAVISDGGGAPLGAGANAIRITNIFFAPSSSCVISVPVTAPTAGVYTNTVPANTLTTTEGSSNADPATGTLSNLAAPAIAKAFSPSTIATGGSSTITFTLSNANSNAQLAGGFTNATFSDSLSGMAIAANGAAGGSCAGAASNTFNAGQTALSFTGLSIPAAGSCTVTVVVTASAAGVYPNTTSGVSATQTTTPGPPSNTANLTVQAPPTVAKAFAPASIVTGSNSRLTLTLSNPNATALTLADPGLIDLFPTTPGQLSVAAVPNLVSTCTGATVNDAANAALAGGALGLRINDGTIPPNSSCTVSVDVTASVIGHYVNTTGLATSNNGGSSAAGASAVLDVIATPIGIAVSGNVYRDANVNGTLDGAEDWSAGAPVFVNLVQNGVVVATITVPAGGGSYQFANVVAGDYRIVISDNGTSVGAVAPGGFQFVTPNDGVQVITVGSTVAPPYNFGLIDGGVISGRVFRDNGPNANNGVQDNAAGEPGLSGVSLRLSDCGATIYGNSRTDGNGDYVLYLPNTVANGTLVCVDETNPSGDLSTGANVAGTALTSGAATTVASTSYLYSRNSTPDRIQFAYSAAARHYPNLNFGDVPPNAFTADNKRTALAGSTLAYPHTYTAQSGGAVTFAIAAVSSPGVTGWVETVYLDADCNGAIDPSDTPITGPLPLSAGQQICIVDREFVPANAPQGAQNVVTISATFTYANANPALASTLSHSDTTVVGDATGAALDLVKTVSSGTAVPGAVLTYTVTYSNRSTLPLSNIVVNDATPPYTRFVSADVGALPASLSACSKTTPAGGPVDCTAAQAAGGRGALSWQFSGSLQPGAAGTVTFQVQVDP